MTNTRAARCFHCQTTFDPIRSKWCDCMQSTRSLVCPSCRRCSCDAPAAWKLREGSTTRRPFRSIPLTEAVQVSSRDAVAEPGSRLRLLVVDDDKFVQLLAREGLSRKFDVMVAKDGVEGLALARETHPDVVVTDALMPGLDGRKLCLTLKSEPATADIRVVIMTSVYRSTRQESESILQFRADAFLRKPVTLTQLARTVEEVGEQRLHRAS